ncbi:hypothetical protein AERO9A_300135 [Aeromonas salmonicida]|nr:hypothetical protein AERO9A_300135 [Aeromonas salmonicida]
MTTNFCMLCFTYEIAGRVWLGSITAKVDEVLTVKLLKRTSLLFVAIALKFHIVPIVYHTHLHKIHKLI